jgi:sugar fermentation stimulation protein A
VPWTPVEAHLPDPGRLTELLVTGRRVLLAPVPETTRRKTRWTLMLVETEDGKGWVSLDTTLPNRLLERVLRSRGLEELPGWTLDRPEVRMGASRFDFLLKGPGGEPGILEAKSVSLREEGRGLFPDAITARGARHLREMAELARAGMSSVLLFVVQREDVESVEAAWAIDPAFAAALEEAIRAGVRVFARRCRVTPTGVTLLPEPIPVLNGAGEESAH